MSLAALEDSSLARRGRKRKEGERYKNGRLKQKKKVESELVLLARKPHRRAVKDELRLDQRAESPLGRLNLKGTISDEQCHAGQLYAVAVGTYRAIIEGPRSTSGAGQARGSCSPLACAIEPEACRCLQVRERYEAAYEALLGPTRRLPACLAWAALQPPELEVAIARAESSRGHADLRRADQAAAKAVAKVVIRGEEPEPEEIVHLKRGLAALARHFGLTGGRRVRQCENTH